MGKAFGEGAVQPQHLSRGSDVDFGLHGVHRCGFCGGWHQLLNLCGRAPEWASGVQNVLSEHGGESGAVDGEGNREIGISSKLQILASPEYLLCCFHFSEIMRSNGFCLANTETIVIDHSIPNGKDQHLGVDPTEHL